MVIEEKDFKIEFSKGDRYDLYLLKTINAKNDEKKRMEFVLEGYDMTLLACIKTIIHYRLNKKLDITTLKNFLIAFRKEKKFLEDALL